MNIVVKFDDVLFNTTYHLYNILQMNRVKYNKYFDLDRMLLPDELDSRPNQSILECLLHNDYKNFSDEQMAMIKMIISKELSNDFYNNKIYKKIEASKLTEKTFMNNVFMSNDNVDNIYIFVNGLSKYSEDVIKELFGINKIKTVIFNLNDSLYDVISDNNIDWDLIIWDDLKNIQEISEKYASLNKKEFMIPKYGYNKMPDRLSFLINGKGGKYTYY